MKLTEQAIGKLNSDLNLRNRLAYEMKKHIDTIQRWINANEDDGDLTKATPLVIISEETGLKQEEILTEEKENHAA